MKTIIYGGRFDYGEERFTCDNCGCEFSSDEYRGYEEYGTIHLIDECPKCHHDAVVIHHDF